MKKTKIIIIAIVLILVLVCGILAYLFLATDLFKSNKKMFQNYASQIEIKNFTDTKTLENYANRLLGEPSKNEGNIEIMFQDINEKFAYKLNNDPEGKKASADVAFFQDGEEKITAKYIKDKDLYGIQCIFKQFLVLENNNLKDFAKKIGINEAEIPDKIEINSSGVNIDEEAGKITSDLEKIAKKYFNNIFEQIPEKKFTKMSNEKIEVDGKTIAVDGYMVTLDENDISDILKKCVEGIKDDTDIFNLVNSINKLSGQNELSWEEYQTEAMNEDEIKIEEPIQLSIAMYKQGKKLVKAYAKLEFTKYQDKGKMYVDISIDNNNTIALNIVSKFDADEDANLDNNLQTVMQRSNIEFSILIKRINENAQTGYNIELIGKSNDQEYRGTIKAILELESEQNYNLNFEINFDNVKILFNNKTSFDSNIQIEEFEKDNMVKLNEATPELLNNIINTFVTEFNKKVDVNKTIIGSILAMNNSLFNNARDASANTKKAQVKEAIALAKADFVADYYSGSSEEINEKTVKEKIEDYLDNVTVKVKKQGDKNLFIITVDGVDLTEKDGTLDLTELEGATNNSIQDSINSAAENADNQAKEIFNMQYSMYEGIQNASNVKALLTRIKSSNQMNTDHIVDSDFEESDIDNSKKYKVSFTKDSDGYINKVNIEEE